MFAYAYMDVFTLQWEYFEWKGTFKKRTPSVKMSSYDNFHPRLGGRRGAANESHGVEDKAAGPGGGKIVSHRINGAARYSGAGGRERGIA